MVEHAQVDLLATIEAIYRVEQSEQDWLRGIVESLARWLDDGLGLFGFTYAVDDTDHVRGSSFVDVGCSKELVAAIPVATANEPEFVRNSYLSRDIGASSQIRGWADSPQAQLAHDLKVFDTWGITGRSWDRQGVAIIVNRSQKGDIPEPTARVLTRIAAHLASGRRLQRLLHDPREANPEIEAIVDPSGRVEHAIGEAHRPEAIRALTRATHARETALGKLRSESPAVALDLWKARVDARWTLVDRFESDGKRYVLARENEPRVEGPATLTSRESQVVASAALGRSNKEIAYELGLAHSTVRVLIARAAKKLGAGQRADLVDRFLSATR